MAAKKAARISTVDIHKDRHRETVPRFLWLHPQEDAALKQLAAEDGVTVTEWVRRAIRLRSGRRTPEAETYIRRIIPEAVARAAERELNDKADALMNLAARHAQDDPAYTRRLRQEAGVLLDRSAWFAQVVSDYAKLPPSGIPTPAGRPTRPAVAPPSGGRPPTGASPAS